MFRSRAERKVAEAGYDPARLPPGQYLTEKWPVLHAGDVAGLPGRPRRLGLPGPRRGRGAAHARVGRARRRCPKATVTQDIHCVTRWSRFDATFTGVAVVGDPRARRAATRARTTRSRTREAGFTANVPASFLEPRARCSSPTPTASRSHPSTAGRSASSSLARTSGRARSGSARSSSARRTRRASGSATATTTTRIPGRSSATPSEEANHSNEGARQRPGKPNQRAPTLPSITEAAVPQDGRLTFCSRAGIRRSGFPPLGSPAYGGAHP